MTKTPIFADTRPTLRVTDIPVLTFPAGEVTIAPDYKMPDEPVTLVMDDPSPTGITIGLIAARRIEEHLDAGWDWGMLPGVLLGYLPAARGDRDHQFDVGIYGPMIAGALSQVDSPVTIVDPHSEDSLSVYEYNLPHATINVLRPEDILDNPAIREVGYQGVIAPDNGGRKRAEKVAEMLGVPVVAQGYKSRNRRSGGISQIGMRVYDRDAQGPMLMVDDICDGGGTFGGLADAMPAHWRVDLYVSHGVFSGDEDRLARNLARYGTVWTTETLPQRPRVGVNVRTLPLPVPGDDTEDDTDEE